MFSYLFHISLLYFPICGDGNSKGIDSGKGGNKGSRSGEGSSGSAITMARHGQIAISKNAACPQKRIYNNEVRYNSTMNVL